MMQETGVEEAKPGNRGGAVKLLFYGLSLAALLGIPVGASADSTITIYPAGSDAFTLRAELLENTGALDITVVYDAGNLAQPRVSCGPLAANATCGVDTATSGVVSLHITGNKPLFGWGTLASLTFSRQGDDPGSISSLDARLTDPSGDAIPTEVKIINPSAEQAAKGPPRRQARPGAARPQPPAGSGGGLLNSGSPTVIPGGSGAGRSSTKGARYRRVESVLDRFFSCSGRETPERLLALFLPPAAGATVQDPPVVLSDGLSTARVTVQVDSGETAPKFLLQGAHFVSLHREEGNRWSLELLPDRGVYRSSVTVLTAAFATEYPLTVAPLETSAVWPDTPEGAGGGQGSPIGNISLPRQLELYIYAANYLALQSNGTGGPWQSP